MLRAPKPKPSRAIQKGKPTNMSPAPKPKSSRAIPFAGRGERKGLGARARRRNLPLGALQAMVASAAFALAAVQFYYYADITSGGRRRAPPPGLFDMDRSAEHVWTDLLTEGARIMEESDARLAVVEVGAHRARRCIDAAESNFEAHCLEPSPESFRMCEQEVQQAAEEVRGRIRLYDVAASSTSGDTVDFISTGGEGDMVGPPGRDMWTMTKAKDTQSNDDERFVKVKTSKVDDLVSENVSPSTDIFAIEIDVRGYEPRVFEGMSESIRRRRFSFVLFKYWPKGVDFMMDVPFDGDGVCKASVEILERLVDAGYALFALAQHVHPHSYAHTQTKMKPVPESLKDKKLRYVAKDRPLGDLAENCMWYYKLERELFPQDDYAFGFWSDFLAVSPEVRLERPSTATGRSVSAFARANG
ncbi:hypothetical protein ACHAWF_015465 [Thalassiosira exigua]